MSAEMHWRMAYAFYIFMQNVKQNSCNLSQYISKGRQHIIGLALRAGKKFFNGFFSSFVHIP